MTCAGAFDAKANEVRPRAILHDLRTIAAGDEIRGLGLSLIRRARD